jgi:hypothetical protein
VEHWHVFAWGTYTGRLSGGIGGNTPGVGQGVAPGTQESDLNKANRLLFWNRDHWHGRGIEAAKVDRCEKQRLAELLWQEMDQCLAPADRLSRAHAAPTDQEG